MKRRLFNLYIVAMLVIVSGTAIRAAPIHVGPANYTGSRSAQAFDEVTGGGAWTTDFTISWNITHPSQTANGLWHYRYDISTATANGLGGGLSHWVLQCSDTVTADNYEDLILNIEVGSGQTPRIGEMEFADYQPDDPSNPNLPGTLHGLKFETPGETETWIEFDSFNDPAWGNFYAKGGVENTAYNSSFLTDPQLNNGEFTGWIASVDSTVIPEPGLCFLGLGALFAGMFARRRSNNGEKEEEEIPA